VTRAIATIVGYAMAEALRRRVFVVVLVLTLAFLGLYGWGASEAFEETGGLQGVPVDARTFIGANLFGLAMFATLFLGTVLAVFLTLGVVRGDAERGLLQPLVVRPIGRATLLVARFLGAGAVCALYVLAVYFAALLITNAASDGWWPDRAITPGLALAFGVVILTALSLLGSVFLSSTANGIAVFMVFGAGLVAGLLGQIGAAIGSETLSDVAEVATFVLPFEALYQSGLFGLTADTFGATGFVLRLGPFGGADAGGPLLTAWSVVYLGLVGALAAAGFARRDL